jgi:hypothetical protein
LIQEGGKADLMPDEVQAIKEAGGSADAIREVIAQGDAAFASQLTDADIDAIRAKLQR